MALDKGYDPNPVYDACASAGAVPIIPLSETTAVKRGEHRAPTCEHGVWTFAGADFKRGRAKWRCPTGECKPGSVWRQGVPSASADPAREQAVRRPLPRTRRRRARVRPLKNEAGLAPLRVRGLDKVALHADLCILATLASALARARAVPLAA